MGAATSIFGQTPPNFQALEQLIARYEVLRSENLDTLQMYTELEKELSAISITQRLQRTTSAPEPPQLDSPLTMSRGPSDASINVLVIDDSPISCKLARNILSRLHFNVTTSESGEEALAILHDHPTEFDLVLLDIVMPKMDGLEVLRRIKQSSALQHITVAMLSGLEDQILGEMCLQCGAAEVILKPLKANAVAKVIRQHCRGRNVEIPPAAATSSGELAVGGQPRQFRLVTTDFTSVDVPAPNLDKKTLLVFFPAAFIFGRSWGSNHLLLRANRHYLAFKSANTDVMGIGRELPYTLCALKEQLELQFPVLCDSQLSASEHYVGTMDLGEMIIQSSGVHMSGLAGYRSSNAGLVLLNEAHRVIYKWVPAMHEVQQEAVVVAEFQKIFQLLKPPEAVISPADGGPQPTSGAQPTIRNIGRASVLVVDDSSISSKLAVRKLSSMGHDAIHAENGHLALELLHRFPTDFDLVLLDIVMPVMDGVELLRKIKEHPQLRKVPVVMLSGLEDEDLAEVCLSTGAMDVFKKPLDMNKVQQLLERLSTTSSA